LSSIDYEEILIYTDGSCKQRSTNSPGGWAFYVVFGDTRKERYGFKDATTNNEMELTAILRALQYVKLTPHPLVIWTDSQYAKRAITEWASKWKEHDWTTAVGDPVKNREVIEEILLLVARHRRVRTVDFKWVKGHHESMENARADALAHEARVNLETNWTQPTKRATMAF
jgi:ribonuclease HI